MNLDNVLAFVIGALAGQALVQNGLILFKKVKEILAKRKAQINVLQVAMANNGALRQVLETLAKHEQELNNIKAQNQSLDQEVKKVVQDNNLVVAGMGRAEGQLNNLEKVAAQSASAVLKLVTLIQGAQKARRENAEAIENA